MDSLLTGMIPGLIGGIVSPIIVLWLLARAIGADNVTVKSFDIKGASSKHRARGQLINVWAESQGMQWVGAYRIRVPRWAKVTLSVWSDGRGTFVILGGQGGRADLQFETYIEGVPFMYLNTKEFQLGIQLPHAPEQVCQVVRGKGDVNVLWATHLDGLSYIHEMTGLMAEPASEPIDALLLRSLRRQSEHIRSHALWPLRLVVSSFATSRTHIKPLRQQRPDLSFAQFQP